MTETTLEELLRQRRRAGEASLPSSFQQNVWREIRIGGASEGGEFGILSMLQWLLRPQYVTGLLAVALLVGIGVGSRRDNRTASTTTQALNLDVFGATAPTLPSTLLDSNL